MENNMEKSMKSEISNTANNTDFTDRMILLRKQKGWSQEDLAERLGVSRQTVSKWELGTSKPKMSTIIEMSKLYNLTTDELINGKDESKAVEIETKVVSDSSTQIIINDPSGLNSEVSNINVKVKTESKIKIFIKKHIRKIIIILALVLLLAYLSFSAYKFCILKEINDKFNSYKDVNNCYIERKEIVTNNETGTAYILNERYWYKDEYLKVEYIKTENGITSTVHDYIDFQKQEKYVVNENTKKIVKRQNIYGYEQFKNGIFEYIIKENYYKDNIDIIKKALDISENVIILNNKYIKKSKNKNENVQKTYNKENAIIEQYYTMSDNEEIKILYDIKINVVKDEDVKIEYVDLDKYELKK